MFTLEVGGFTLLAASESIPPAYDYFRERARLVEEFALEAAEGGRPCFLGIVRPGEDAPALVVAQRARPAGYGFEPGALLIPETGRLFVGAGTRLLAYDLRPAVPVRLWVDEAGVGFTGWQRHGDLVLMSAELELAAWDLEARKLWSTGVEPPWSYAVRGDLVALDVMGKASTFLARTGPAGSGAESPN